MYKKLVIISLFSLNLFSSSFTLEDIYFFTLKNNDSLKSLEFQKRVAKEEIALSKANLYPRVEGSISHTERDYILNVSGADREEIYDTYKVTLRQTIYDKSIYESLDESYLRENFEKLRLFDEEQKVVLESLSLYLDVLLANSALDNSLVSEEYYTHKLLQFKKLFEKDLISKDAYDKLILDLNTALVNTLKSRNDLAMALSKLSMEVGVEIQAGDLGLSETSKLFVLEEVEADLLSKSLPILKAQAEYALAKQRVEVAQSKFYPSVELQGHYSEFESNNIYNDYKEDKQMMFVVKVPLYSGGYNFAKNRQEKLRSKSAHFALESQINATKNSYKTLILQKRILEESISLKTNNLVAAKEYLGSIERSYEKRIKSIVDLKEAEVRVSDLEHEIEKNKIDRLKTILELKYLFGSLVL